MENVKLSEKRQIVCRFCFGKRDIDEVLFDIFTSKIGTRTIFDSVKFYFAVLEKKSYKEYLNFKWWDSEYTEIVNFVINDDATILRGICVKCFQTLVEIDSVAERIRRLNLTQFAIPSFFEKLKNCKLKSKNGDTIPSEEILSALFPKQHYEIDEYANFWDTCRFCLQHESMLLFDIFLSKIGGCSIDDVIKMCSATFKVHNVNIFVHHRQSDKKSIFIPDYIWKETEANNVPRKICLSCLQPLIKFKFLIERIRKTNAALSLVDLSCNLKGSIGISLLYTSLEKLLGKCQLHTTKGEAISKQQIIDTMQLTRSYYEMYEAIKRKKMFVTPYECTGSIDSIVQTESHSVSCLDDEEEASTISPVFCGECNTDIQGSTTLDEHILKHIQDSTVDKTSNVCTTCLEMILRGETRCLLQPSDDWKRCSMCKLRKYLEIIDDTDLSFHAFSLLYC